MQKTRLKKSLSLIDCIVLIAAMALFTTGCTDNKEKPENPPKKETVQTEVTVLGKGETAFDFTVTNAAGEETAFEIHTDKTIVGEALQELDLISGDDGDFGLFVKTVYGETHVYETDGMFWAFYENDSQASKGVDQTEIVEGTTYGFKAEEIR